MRLLLILTLSLCFACNNITEQGFTNKSEAKNEIVDGVKEGKWCEYVDIKGNITNDSTFHVADSIIVHSDSEGNSYYTLRPWYRLVIYKHGEPFGISRDFYRNGKLFFERHYENGKISGIMKEYDRNGKVVCETEYSKGLKNGVQSEYTDGGKLKAVSYYYNDTLNGVSKYYYKSGILNYETPYSRGRINGISKDYFDSSGGCCCECLCVNDTPIVQRFYYFKSEKLNLERHYNKGEYNGTEKEYYRKREIKTSN